MLGTSPPLSSSKIPKVTVPSNEADRPKLGQVGAIAGVCFAIGVIWPTLAGVKLVPTVPTKEHKEKPKAEPKPERSPSSRAPTSEVPVAAAVPRETGQGEQSGPSVQIDKTLVVNCRDKDDRKLSECDKPGFDDVAENRLKALASCEGAQDATGVLSIGFDLDFGELKIKKISKGKSSTLDDETADGLVECAKREFMSATLQGVEHTHARYLVFYMVDFKPPGASEAESLEADPQVNAKGTATIIWNSARIRTEPKDGKLKTRLLYGTRVVVTARQGDWYKVRYDARGNEGWVHKNALAM